MTDKATVLFVCVHNAGPSPMAAGYPGQRYEDWELDDPAGQPIDQIRGIRDDRRPDPHPPR